MDSHNTTLGLCGQIFFGRVKSPWFYTELPMDKTHSVSMDFLARRVPEYTG